MSNQVIIQNAVKRYGDFTALNGVSLDIQEGEFFTLLGPSGCGKTTLLRMIAGFNSIEGGDFYFGEKRINDVPAHKRDIGMVFQNYAIFPHLTVRENVAYGLKARKMPAKEIKPKVDEALELVQISHLADRKPNELSGGQLQRISIIRSMFLNPGFIIADEPVSMLDVSVRAEIINMLIDLARNHNAAVVFISHDIALTRYISDNIAVMYLGRIVEYGSADEVIKNPQHPYTRALISNCASVDPFEEHEEISIEGEPPTPINPGPGCYFAPRCYMATEECFKSYPERKDLGGSLYAVCSKLYKKTAGPK